MDFTPVILVSLAIAWAAAGIYWVRSRALVPQLISMPTSGRRRVSPLAASFMTRSDIPHATVHPLRSMEPSAPSSTPGYSLSQPARRASLPSIGGRYSSEQARLRRRAGLIGLGGLAFVTLLGAVALGGRLVLLHLFVDAMLLAYVLVLVQYHREIELQRTQHRPVYARTTADLGASSTEDHFAQHA